MFGAAGLFALWRTVLAVLDADEHLAFQGRFASPLSVSVAVASYATMTLAVSIAALVSLGLHHGTPRLSHLKAVGVLAAVPAATLWGKRYMTEDTFPVHMAWLPILGPISMAVAWYIDAEMRQLTADAEGLQKLRYPCKSV